jgi:glutamate N-acetyltransferase/amino-acid N-acetyltransferase
VVVNSWCANACTGEVGCACAVDMAAAAASAVGCAPHEVLIASTGVIGVLLDIERYAPV